MCAKLGLKVGGFKGETLAQALGPMAEPASASQIAGETHPNLPQLLAPSWERGPGTMLEAALHPGMFLPG